MKVVSPWLSENLAVWPETLPKPTPTASADVRVEDGDSVPAALLRSGHDWLTLHSRRDPILEAERLLARIGATHASVLFAVGLGLGYLLDALERDGWGGRVVAFEPEPALVPALLERRDWRSWLSSGRLTILLGPSYEALDLVAPTLEPDRPEPVVAINPVLARARPSAVKQALEVAARAWTGARANQEARREHAGRYLLNSLRNLPALASEGDAAALTRAFTNVPAVVIGAGPSLDRNLPDLQKYRDRALLVAVDTALRPLLAAGVPPDLVVAVDPGEANARHLTELPDCSRTFLVGEGSLDPEVLRSFAGRTFVFRVADHHPWPWLRTIGFDRGRLRAWGSVLTTTFDLTLMMGCEPIAFAGADLAFTDGRLYARGTTYEEDWAREARWGQTHETSWARRVEAWPETWEAGVERRIVRTAPHLRSFRDWIVTQAAKAERHIVNATGAGILIGGSINQAALEPVLRPHQPVYSTDEILVRAHQGDRGAAARMEKSVDRLRQEIRAGASATLESWLAFGGQNLGGIDAVLQALGERSCAPDSARREEARPEHDIPSEIDHPADRETFAAYAAAGRPWILIGCRDPLADLAGDIERAWAGVPDGGRLFVVDRTGSQGGAAVRRALLRFLARHPEVTSRHGRFLDPESTLSWIERRGPDVSAPPDLDKFTPQHEAVAERLVPFLVQHLSPRSVLDVGCGAGYWLRAFGHHGVTDVSGVEDRALLEAAGCEAPNPQITGSDLSAFRPADRVDLCLCIGVVQRVSPEVAESVVAACAQASDTIAFSAPGAGLGVAAYINDRPLSYWHRRFWDHGYAVYDVIRPSIEAGATYYLSSHDLLVVYRRVKDAQSRWLSSALECALLGAADRMDDQVIQRQWYASTLDAARTRAEQGASLALRYEWLELPPARLERVDGCAGARLFRFRTMGAIHALRAPGVEPLRIEEDARSLRPAAHCDGVRSGAPGQFAMVDDGITLSSTDGTDPRRNGRLYRVRVPAHVAWLEQVPLQEVLRNGL